MSRRGSVQRKTCKLENRCFAQNSVIDTKKQKKNAHLRSYGNLDELRDRQPLERFNEVIDILEDVAKGNSVYTNLLLGNVNYVIAM